MGGSSKGAVTELVQVKELPLAGCPSQVSLAAAAADEAAEIRRIAEGSFTPDICFELGRAFKPNISGDCKSKVTEWSVSRSLWLSLVVAGTGLAVDGKLFQRFCCLQAQVSNLESTLQVLLRAQASQGSDLARTLQGS